MLFKPMSDIEKRKQEHLDLSLHPEVRGPGADFSNIQLPYDALFQISPDELDTRSTVAGIAIGFPLMFGAITGGIQASKPFNTLLRSLANRYHLAMELGSIRPVLKNPDCIETYGTGHVDALFANIGMSEITRDNVDRIAVICEKLGASGLCIHLNGLQEYVQDGGNHAFSCDIDVLSAFVEKCPIPVLIKEVGSGIGGKCAQTLAQLPIAGIETASRGGTSWIKIEALRRQKPFSDANIRALDRLGYDIQTSIKDCRKALGYDRTVIASGGIEAPDDFVKSLMIGADCAAIAQPLYRAWHENGETGLAGFVEEFIDIAKLVWRSTGCRSLKALQQNAMSLET